MLHLIFIEFWAFSFYLLFCWEQSWKCLLHIITDFVCIFSGIFFFCSISILCICSHTCRLLPIEWSNCHKSCWFSHSFALIQIEFLHISHKLIYSSLVFMRLRFFPQSIDASEFANSELNCIFVVHAIVKWHWFFPFAACLFKKENVFPFCHSSFLSLSFCRHFYQGQLSTASILGSPSVEERAFEHFQSFLVFSFLSLAGHFLCICGFIQSNCKVSFVANHAIISFK